jgi:predicted nucleic acid-binding protein
MIVYQGESAILVGETALDITDYEDIRVIVYDRNNNIIVSAAMVAATGYDETIFRDTDDKEFEVLISPEITEVAVPGKYYAEVQTKFDDTDWSEYIYNTGQSYVFDIAKARLYP